MKKIHLFLAVLIIILGCTSENNGHKKAQEFYERHNKNANLNMFINCMIIRHGDGFKIDIVDSITIPFFFVDYDENKPTKLRISQVNKESIIRKFGNVYTIQGHVYDIQDPQGERELLLYAHKLLKTYHELDIGAIFGCHGKNEYIEFIMPEVIVVYIPDRAKISSEQYQRLKEKDRAKNLDDNWLYYAAKGSE